MKKELSTLVLGAVLALTGCDKNLEYSVEQEKPQIVKQSVKYGISNPNVSRVVDNLLEIETARGIGNGVFLDDHTILTAHHVILDGHGSVEIPIYLRFRGSRIPVNDYSTFTAVNTDITLVSLRNPMSDVPELPLYRDPRIVIGQSLQMVGFRVGEFTNTFGSIEGFDEVPQGSCRLYLKTDINVRRGNSGSPVINGTTGEIMGIVSQGIFQNRKVDEYSANGKGVISLIANLHDIKSCHMNYPQ